MSTQSNADQRTDSLDDLRLACACTLAHCGSDVQERDLKRCSCGQSHDLFLGRGRRALEKGVGHTHGEGQEQKQEQVDLAVRDEAQDVLAALVVADPATHLTGTHEDREYVEPVLHERGAHVHGCRRPVAGRDQTHDREGQNVENQLPASHAPEGGSHSLAETRHGTLLVAFIGHTKLTRKRVCVNDLY